MDQAYSKIRYAILEGQFAPGTHLGEIPLASRLGTGRFHIREALMRLLGEGLVERVRNAGFFVRHLTLEEIEETFEIRSALECLATRIACRRGFSELRLNEMERICDAMAEATRNRDWRAVDQLDLQFHQVLISLANSKRVEALAHSSHVQMFSWRQAISAERRKSDAEGVIPTHRRIVDRLRARDVEGAVRVVFEHTAPFFSPQITESAAEANQPDWLLRHMSSVGELTPNWNASSSGAPLSQQFGGHSSQTRPKGRSRERSKIRETK